jgi:adenylate cyclase
VSETRKLAAILVSDVVGYSRLAGADEDRILARLRTLRSDLIDPTIAVHHGRIVKRTGDGSIIEFRSVVDAVNCAIELQRAMVERNAGVAPDKRIEFRIGIHLGDVVEESDSDLMGDGVNIAARLEGVCEPGGVCLSEDAYRQVKSRLDLAVTDLGPTQLKNIAEPIRVYSLHVGVPGQAKPRAPAKPPEPNKRLSAALLGIVALLLVLAAGGWYWLTANRPAAVATGPPAPVASSAAAPAEAKHLSIVVLPFTNLSGDPSQDYFADGVTENLTTELSRIKGSFVIARNTAFTYKGKTIDAKEIGKELGVRYVLEGSVQRDQNRVRVNAQLIDAETGAHLWADRFEEDITDLFKLQDQVVARLGNALGFELVKAEAAKSASSRNPDAIDLAMRGWATMWQSYPMAPKDKRDSHYAALALFDQALKADPNDADALAGDAFTHMALFTFGEATAETNLDEKIIDQADRAIALAPDNMRAYAAKSFYLAATGRANEALRAAESGLAIDPNDAPLLDARTLAEIVLGRFEQAKSDAEQAMRLSPRDPETPNRLINLGMAELGLGHFDAAIAEFQRAIDAGAHYFIPYANLAAAYALAGKMDEAKTALAEGRRLNPNLTVKWLTDHAPKLPPLIEGLRKAGLPEE